MRVAIRSRDRTAWKDLVSVGLRGISTGFDGVRIFAELGETTGVDSGAVLLTMRRVDVLTASGLDHTGALDSLVRFGLDSFNLQDVDSGDGDEDEYLKERGTSMVKQVVAAASGLAAVTLISFSQAKGFSVGLRRYQAQGRVMSASLGRVEFVMFSQVYVKCLPVWNEECCREIDGVTGGTVGCSCG